MAVTAFKFLKCPDPATLNSAVAALMVDDYQPVGSATVYPSGEIGVTMILGTLDLSTNDQTAVQAAIDDYETRIAALEDAVGATADITAALATLTTNVGTNATDIAALDVRVTALETP